MSTNIIHRNRRIIFLVVVNVITATSCKKFIEVPPPVDKITEANIFNNDITATTVLTGIYSNISQRGLSTSATSTPNLLTLSKLAGLVADELDLWSGAYELEKAYYQNELQTSYAGSVEPVGGEEMWTRCYGFIYACNQAIIGIEKTNALSIPVKQQLLGEAKFLRSFFYYYLVNLYGEVPLVISTDPEHNRLLPRAAKSDIYGLIISDLVESKKLLSETFLGSDLKPSQERVRPTKWAASALLARVYLFIEDFSKAEMEATDVISQSSLFDVSGVALTDVFLKNSRETIWQLQPVTTGWNTLNARWFALNNSPKGFSLTKSVHISSTLYDAFEKGDNRKNIWIGAYITTTPDRTYYFPSKYKAGQDPSITAENIESISEYHMVLRMAEQYLIRAEARAHLNNLAGAIADLNVIRTRARALPNDSIPDPLPDLSSSLTKQQIIDTTIHEKRIELFTEWGHRWLDLKRTNSANAVMTQITPLKGGSWQTTDQYFPLPGKDLQFNPNLIQNPGYR